MTTHPGDSTSRSHSHYFDSSPTSASSPRTLHVALPDVSFDFTSDAGVFGRHRLDPGTKILLQEAPELPDHGTFLDLGCGAGPIALTMALRRPTSRVWAVDVNQRARDLVTSNARSLGVDNVVVASPQDVPEDLFFDIIWSNPPIKIGKSNLHALLEKWLTRLTPQGSALLVVHKNLGSDSLATWCRTQGWDTRRLVSRQGYRLLRVTPSR